MSRRARLVALLLLLSSPAFANQFYAPFISEGASSPLAAGLTSGTTTISGGTDKSGCFDDGGFLNCHDGWTWDKATGTEGLTNLTASGTGTFGTLAAGVVGSGSSPVLRIASVGGLWSDYYGPPDYNDGEIAVSLPGINEQMALFYASNAPGTSDLSSSISLRPPSGNGSHGLEMAQTETGASNTETNQSLSGVVNARGNLTSGLYLGAAGGPVHIYAGGTALTDESITINANHTVNVASLKATGAATGKNSVCVDTTTGQLYASSSGVACAD